MNRITKSFVALAATVLTSGALSATTYTVGYTAPLTFNGVDRTHSVRINVNDTWMTVYAGLANLTFGGVAVQGLCIDPFEFAGNGVFTVSNLTDAPATRELSTYNASRIGKLWAEYFGIAKSDKLVAASLQVAVWEIVGGDAFNTSWSTTVGAAAKVMIDNITSADPEANLVALTNEGYWRSSNGNRRNNNRTEWIPGKQDFVVEQVPDGGTTVILLGLGLTGLALMRRRI